MLRGCRGPLNTVAGHSRNIAHYFEITHLQIIWELLCQFSIHLDLGMELSLKVPILGAKKLNASPQRRLISGEAG
jgi:hypothetical protein